MVEVGRSDLIFLRPPNYSPTTAQLQPNSLAFAVVPAHILRGDYREVDLMRMHAGSAGCGARGAGRAG